MFRLTALAALAALVLPMMAAQAADPPLTEADRAALNARCTEGDDIEACAYLGAVLAQTPAGRADPEITTYNRLACDGGYVASCFLAGVALDLQSKGSDIDLYMPYYEQACDDAGNATGCLYGGEALNAKIGTPEANRRAHELFTAGCTLQNGKSCSQAAYDFGQGRGVDTDLPRAHALYLKACELDYGIGCANVVSTHLQMNGSENADIDFVKRFARKACDHDVASMCDLLGKL